MKYLLPLFILLASCSGGDAPVSTTSTLPIDIYKSNGEPGIHLTQTNGGTLTTIYPVVEGTSFVVYMDGCKLSYDVSVVDSVNTAYWLTQPVAIDIDMTAQVCATPRTYTYGAPTFDGAVYRADFTIN